MHRRDSVEPPTTDEKSQLFRNEQSTGVLRTDKTNAKSIEVI